MATVYDKSIAYKNFNGDIWYRNFPNNSGTSSTGPLPGEPGWGCGVYPGNDLEDTLGLFPMEGCDNPKSDNYGNYQNADGSVFCFIPKFYYSFDCKTTDVHYQDVLTYSKLTVEQVAEIVNRSPNNYFVIAPGSAFTNEAEANEHGFILHRAFIDGGVEKSGFFIMKYLASKGVNGSTESTKALSVKNGTIISCNMITQDAETAPFSSSAMPDCEGRPLDVVILSKAINPNLNCASSFMYSALLMQSKFIGTIATSTNQCAWYDNTLQFNYPKGCNYLLASLYDATVTFTNQYGDACCLAGSGTPFNKTTHNGLANGVADIVGCRNQITIGMLVNYTNMCVFNKNIAISDITKDNVINADETQIYDKYPVPFYWADAGSTQHIAMFLFSSSSETSLHLPTAWMKDPDGLVGLGRDVEGILPSSVLQNVEFLDLLSNSGNNYEYVTSLFPEEDLREFNNSSSLFEAYSDDTSSSGYRYCTFARNFNSYDNLFGDFFSTAFSGKLSTVDNTNTLPSDGFRAGGYAS